MTTEKEHLEETEEKERLDETEINDIDLESDPKLFNKSLESFEKKYGSYEEKLRKKYGPIRLFFIKYKLGRYLNKRKKYYEKAAKYGNLHSSLALAVSSGFPTIKSHQEYLKTLVDKIENRNNLIDTYSEPTDKQKIQKIAGIK